jgi:HAD superfamily hydrolase (TIGR01509 family)
MRRRSRPVRLVIFDCDGVLVDSEGIANRVTAACISQIGWAITPADADRQFLGMTLTDMIPLIETQIGGPVPAGWRQNMMEMFLEQLARDVVAIPGAISALNSLDAMAIPWRIASNSSHEEMSVKFSRLALTERVAGRVHSYRDVSHGKPAPDLYLAAASASNVAPEDCLVIEDSAVGASAAVAAGMDCLGYAPHDDGAALAAVGAVPFRSMYDVSRYVSLAQRISA